MTKSRKVNTYYNFFSSVFYQFFNVFIRFLSRTIFINYLGIEYLGISSLFANILSVLSLAELGAGSALVYSMYRPLAEENHEKIRQLINYYKYLYRIIAIVILVFGISLMPWLHLIINLDTKIDNVYLYYILFLCNTVCSYFNVYKTSILIADQREYKIRKYKIIIEVITFAIQSFTLIILKNYIIYLIVQIFSVIIINSFVSSKVSKLYPYLDNINESLSSIEKKEIWTNIKAMFSYKIGGVILNNTDQIFISMLVNTMTVGLYSNYLMIINALSSIVSLIFLSVKSSIGNLATECNSKKEYKIFQILDIIAFYVYGTCSIALLVLSNDFISIWVGSEYILSFNVNLIIVITFYMTGFLYPILCYRETIGLFKDTKNILIYASLINIILSYVLGKNFGLAGVLIATVLARLLTNVWYEPYKLFSIYFKNSYIKFFVKQIFNILIIVLTYLVIVNVVSIINISNIFLAFIIKGITCVILCLVIFTVYSYLCGNIRLVYGFLKGE